MDATDSMKTNVNKKQEQLTPGDREKHVVVVRVDLQLVHGRSMINEVLKI